MVFGILVCHYDVPHKGSQELPAIMAYATRASFQKYGILNVLLFGQ